MNWTWNVVWFTWADVFLRWCASFIFCCMDLIFFTAVILCLQNTCMPTFTILLSLHTVFGVSHNPEQIKPFILQHRRTFPEFPWPKASSFQSFQGSERKWKVMCWEENLGRLCRAHTRAVGPRPWRLERSRSISTFELPVTSQPDPKLNPTQNHWNTDPSGQLLRGHWSSSQCRLLPRTCTRGGVRPVFLFYHCSLVKDFPICIVANISLLPHVNTHKQKGAFSWKLLWMLLELINFDDVTNRFYCHLLPQHDSNLFFLCGNLIFRQNTVCCIL